MPDVAEGLKRDWLWIQSPFEEMKYLEKKNILFPRALLSRDTARR